MKVSNYQIASGFSNWQELLSFLLEIQTAFIVQQFRKHGAMRRAAEDSGLTFRQFRYFVKDIRGLSRTFLKSTDTQPVYVEIETEADATQQE